MYRQIANQIFVLTKTTNHKTFSTCFYKHELHKHTKVKATQGKFIQNQNWGRSE